jgi:hypothetical protein
MKTKLLYIMLVCGILVLLVIAGVMTSNLLKLSISNAPKTMPAARQVKQHAPVVSETYIEVAGPTAQKRIAAVHAKAPAASPGTVSPVPVPAQTSAIPAVAIAVVIEVRGTALATGAGGKLRPLAKDSRVYLNEKIETVAASSVKIKFDDGTTISQGENSSVVIDQYVYNPNNRAETRFTMYLLKGACHTVTGLIPEINPERFKVRTRLATVGIRGCDLAFRSKPEQDDIYILGLTGKENITVNTTTDGRQIVNVITREETLVDEAKKKTIDVNESGRVVSIVSGKGPEERALGLDEADKVMTETSSLTPAIHGMNLAPDGAVFTIQPREQTTPGSTNEVK